MSYQSSVKLKPQSILKISVFLLILLGFLCAESAEQKVLKIGDQLLQVELAATPTQRRQGLMFRENLADNQGMLFIYPDSKPRRFWMKNTLIPLSVGLFDENRRLVEIFHMDPPDPKSQNDLPITTSHRPARYALEVRQGWFDDHGITLGEIFKLP